MISNFHSFPARLLSSIRLLREEMMSLPWVPTKRDNMAKKQRGKGASLQKKAENEKGVGDFNLALDSSDDEAPEEVTFEDSKARAVESLKLALDTARRWLTLSYLKGSYTVSTATDRGQSDYQRQAAEDFIQSRLYGPGSCRSSNNEMLSLKNKTRADKSAAVQFVKKDWGAFKNTINELRTLLQIQ
uniref:U3 small nucleolar RNA-associated protein NOL7 C-terminal domain-containing protein n=1 Tax=Poecilia mexicana TaxID=48701 RepID=A0A3B3WST5_9TELE